MPSVPPSPVPGRLRGAHVLVVHAEQLVRDGVTSALRAAGFVTREAGSARGAEGWLSSFRPDLVVVGGVLPDAEGLEIVRRLAQTLPRTPAIILGASVAPEDKVAGLALADDYVASPFSAPEIAARVRAVLRRTRRGDAGILRFADVSLDDVTHEVRRAERPVALTPREFALLRFFLRNPGRVLTKDEILTNVWGDSAHAGQASVETYVSYLRRKLDRLGPPLIRTVRLVGYALREP
jgi:two-component system OmpR family response regulator